jgi:hypothetical protein
MDLQEPRTNVAYMLLKYSEARIFSPEVIGRLWAALFADLVEEAGLTDRLAKALDRKLAAALPPAQL